MTAQFMKISEEKQELIIETALIEFGTYGYELASTNRLVKEVGISKGSLFKYFNTKLELYAFLVKYTTEELMNYLEASISKSNKSWDKIVLEYASVEFDYLIYNDVHYHFYSKMLKEMDSKTFEPIKEILDNSSNAYYNRISNALGLNERLFNHIQFVLKGFHDYFMKQYDDQNFTITLKKAYMEELKTHLSLINVSGS